MAEDQAEFSFAPPNTPLGRLSERMLSQVDRSEVRGLLLLDDETSDKSMVVPFGHLLGNEDGLAEMFAEIADHMVNFWHVFGMRLDLTVNGHPMPVHPLFESEGALQMADNGAERTVVSGFLQAVEARIAALEADAEKALQVGELELANLKKAFATEFKALAAEIESAFGSL